MSAPSSKVPATTLDTDKSVLNMGCLLPAESRQLVPDWMQAEESEASAA
jgi:hypothetical protein